MAAPENRLSIEPVISNILDPDSRNRGQNEDFEAGPVAVTDTSEGLFHQAWHLTFAGGIFTITPETTGTPVDVLTGQDSTQCSLAFDQNARPSIAWITTGGQAKLYWYDTTQSDFVITDLPAGIRGVMLCLDDKRVMQTGASDILLWFTVLNGSQYDLYQARQRDRFDPPILQKEGVWPLFNKLGMADGLRVQFQLLQSSEPLPPQAPRYFLLETGTDNLLLEEADGVLLLEGGTSDQKLSDLDEVITLSGTDEIYVNDAGTTKRITWANLMTYLES